MISTRVEAACELDAQRRFGTARRRRLPRRYPGVDVRLTELDPGEAIDQLHARELDLALVNEFPVEEVPPLDGLEYVHLLDDRPTSPCRKDTGSPVAAVCA